MLNVLSWIGGFALILLTMTDVFRSLLVPRANARLLRLGPLLGRVLFGPWHAVADRLWHPRVQQGLRAMLAPTMLLASLVIWAALMVVGFGLLFWADRNSFQAHFATVSDAIYAAGTTFSTLNTPGSVASGFGRLAVVACSLGGLGLVTVVATFLISLQGGYGRRETLVLRLEAHVTLPPAGIAILETYAKEDIVHGLGAFFAAWEQWAAEVAISHRAFPILLFFRSNDSRCEWLAALGAVMDAAALLDSTVVEAPAGAKAGAHFLLRTGARLLRDVAKIVANGSDEQPDLADAERFRQHRERLAAAGYAVADDEARALECFVERRRGYASQLVAVARRLRIEIDERHAGEDDSAPVE